MALEMVNLAISEMALQVWEAVGAEIFLFVVFSLGFGIFRSEKMQRLVGVPKKAAKAKKFDSDPDAPRAKQIEADFAAGQFESVLNAWPELQNVTAETLLTVVRSFLELHKYAEMQEALRTILELNTSLCTAWTMNSVLGVVCVRGINLGLQVYDAFQANGVSANDATFENILAGLTDASPERAAEVSSHMKIRMTARVYSLLIKRAIKSKRIDRALSFVAAMHEAGHVIPPSCLGVIFRSAGEMGCLSEVMKTLPGAIAYPAEAVGAILESAQKTGDMQLLKATHKKAIEEKVELTYVSYDALIKAYASKGDSKAVALFDEVLSKGLEPSEGSLIGIIALCAESRHVQMAERAVEYSKGKGKVSLAMYSALMKVYATSRLFNKTCDLYESMAKDGVELDTVAYGCLIKAAAESGRQELARKLFRQSGNPDLLNYMSLIRAAGREKNSRKALELLKELEESPIDVDTTAYNCVLDVCVACGDCTAAQELFERMKVVEHVDVISYNTVLKGLTKQEAWAQVETVLQEMRSRGVKPNVVTYNSLINAFISHGDMASAWRYLEDMESYGVAMDAFTCSIMMKGLKHSSRREDVDRILALMDKAKVVPDEVLVNTLLDSCVRLRDPRRLNQALDQFKASGVVPSMHAHATLIKAYGHAHRIDQAWRVWRELMHERKTSPNEEVYSCMIDACVNNDDLDGAMKLFLEMRKQIPNYSKGGLVFSSLVKGFAQRKEIHRAMELYEQMSSDPVACTLVTYNTLIDTCARTGEMTKVSKLFKDMCERGVDPDLITYSTVIKGYCVQGDLEQAIQLFTLMRKRGIKPDAILFNSILDGCARKQMRTLTEQVLRDMEDANVAPSNFTLSILVKLYGRTGDVERAFEVAENYPAKYGFDLNATVYTCLMSSCISNDRLEKAMEVFEMMKTTKCSPDAKTYQTLINGCLKKGSVEQAVKLVDDAMGLDGKGSGARFPLESETIENVLFMISRRQKSQELGAPLLERLGKAGFEVSARAKASLGRGAAQNVGNSSRFHARRIVEN